MTWARHVSRSGEVHTGFWWGNVRARNLLEHLGVDERIILKWDLKNRFGHELDSSGSG
jgi:hypothetical protein